eukprot:Nk52_evm2s370 gene=Nk52_evmTU2s370
MFFHTELNHEILLHPRYFGPRLSKILLQKLNSEIEGTCMGKHGFVIMVTEVVDISKGKIQEGLEWKGLVTFSVKYKAVVFRPFKGEVLDAIVKQVTKVGVFAEVGPLSIFISRFLIPSDMVFDGTNNPPAYRNAEDSIQISKDDEIRLKVLNIRVDANEIFAIGTIKEDYLGVI